MGWGLKSSALFLNYLAKFTGKISVSKGRLAFVVSELCYHFEFLRAKFIFVNFQPDCFSFTARLKLTI